MSIVAVITADIVNSTLLSSQQYKKLIGNISAVLKDQKFEFYRGDSFQVYVKNPQIALEIIFRIRTAARSLSPIHDIRASIGIGQVRLPIKSLKTAKSEAFVLSGRGFDELQNSSYLKIKSFKEEANSSLKIIAYFSDYIFSGLTPKQAAVVFQLMQNHTQAKVAKKLKKSQATINKHAQSGGWSEIERLLNEYQQVLTQFKLT
jgi:hypothetical protein